MHNNHHSKNLGYKLKEWKRRCKKMEMIQKVKEKHREREREFRASFKKL